MCHEGRSPALGRFDYLLHEPPSVMRPTRAIPLGAQAAEGSNPVEASGDSAVQEANFNCQIGSRKRACIQLLAKMTNVILAFIVDT